MDEVLEKLIEEDNNFSEAKFKAKVDNVCIQLYTAVMKQNFKKVKHFLSDEVYENIMRKLKYCKRLSKCKCMTN
ncbi:MAG: TIM44-like domain-containing protein [Clostridia bacterium]|nr:TIM44-like domain-containing protein [Clostridia bacterium]